MNFFKFPLKSLRYKIIWNDWGFSAFLNVLLEVMCIIGAWRTSESALFLGKRQAAVFRKLPAYRQQVSYPLALHFGHA